MQRGGSSGEPRVGGAHVHPLASLLGHCCASPPLPFPPSPPSPLPSLPSPPSLPSLPSPPSLPSQSPKQHHKLLCFYFTNRRKPRLILRPVKVEVVFPRPKIFVFRDILSEQEMARLRELAQPLVRGGARRGRPSPDQSALGSLVWGGWVE